MKYEDVVYARRAINFFDPEKDVSEEMLDKVISLAAQAPSGFNLQPWNLMILRDKAKKEKLQALAWNQPKVSEAPITLIVLADMDGWKSGHPTVEKNWKEMIASGSMTEDKRDWFLNATQSLYRWSDAANVAFAVKNASFFSMALMYAATNYGLETHPMDGFDHEGVKKAFNIPDNFWIPVLISLGYRKPGVELHDSKWRKTVEDIKITFPEG
ncbi:nitroreductase family protein [Desulfogranum japonicum]|uniref:nitroreductase family protein n=1 Tax=Desulfogranum japonicum TaxID=231447 RepID=UPI000429F9D3|nr:nitroreductase family protein [Desulfogranum japonicum]